MGMATRGSQDINVTPLIDVLLVLLVIFMIVTPVVLKLEQVQLPPTRPGVEGELPVVVKVNADLTVAVDDEPPIASVRELAARLRVKLALAKVVFVEFTDGVPWREVVATVDTVRSLASDGDHDNIPVAIRMHQETP
jgi:biopolymer transport protein TolR